MATTVFTQFGQAELVRGSGIVNNFANTANGPATVSFSPACSTAGSGSFAAGVQGVTIAGTITLNAWMLESSMNNNAGASVLIERVDSNGNLLSTILSSAKGVELGTTSAAQNWTATPTSTTLNDGDNLRITWRVTDAGGTMLAAANGARLAWGGTTGGVDGDTFVTFTEAITAFVPAGGSDPTFPYQGSGGYYGTFASLRERVRRAWAPGWQPRPLRVLTRTAAENGTQ